MGDVMTTYDESDPVFMQNSGDYVNKTDDQIV
jgi:hypothetical protein